MKDEYQAITLVAKFLEKSRSNYISTFYPAPHIFDNPSTKGALGMGAHGPAGARSRTSSLWATLNI